MNHFHHDQSRLDIKEGKVVLTCDDVDHHINPIFLNGSIWDISHYARACIYAMKAKMAQSTVNRNSERIASIHANRDYKIKYALKEHERKVDVIERVHDADLSKHEHTVALANRRLARYNDYQNRTADRKTS